MTNLRRWFPAAAVLFVSVGPAGAQYLISTNGGGLPAVTAATATAYAFQNPNGAATDRFGHTYFSSGANCVFRLDPSGYLSRVAGTCQQGFSGDSGLAVNAQLSGPEGVAVDSSGNLYIADSINNRIRKVTPAGVISTFAGTGVGGYSGDNGAATGAQLNSPQGISLDLAGNLYVADQGNQRIRKITPGGTITTYAGTGTTGSGGDGGPATSATLTYPVSVAVDSVGNLYLGDSTYQVRVISPGGIITHVAGLGFPGGLGDGGAAATAQIGYPAGLAVDSAGNVYISDQNALRIRKINTGGIINNYAGGGNSGVGDGGQATNAQLYFPQGLAVDYAGNLYIADQNRVRKVNTGGTISTVAGTGGVPYGGDGGFATLAQFSENWGVARDAITGNLYVVDAYNCRVRKITPAGIISTFAGTGTCGYAGDNGQAAAAQINPFVAATDSAGDVYIDGQAVVRMVATGGAITTVAGTGVNGFSGDNNPATSARLSVIIRGLAVDGSGNLYISDYGNNRVRKVSGGTITTVAGNGTANFSGDGGPGTSAELNGPSSLAVDGMGNLYIADSGNYRVRKLATNGTITTYAGNGMQGNTGDGGLATMAEITSPNGLAVDSGGNLYIATHGNVVRKVTLANTISTVAGTGNASYSGDGGPAASAQISNPEALTTDGSGNVFLSDSLNAAVRVMEPVGTEPLLEVTSAHSGNFTAGQTGTIYTVMVNNTSQASATSGTVTVTETVPTGLSLANMTGSGWSCGGNVCTTGTSVSGGNGYGAITVVTNVASNAPPQVTNLVTVSGGGSPQASAADPTYVTGVNPVLDIAATHTGNFVQSGHGEYTIFVGDDVTAAATSGTVTVTENLPSGLTLSSMTGMGWTCLSNSCQRSDALTGGSGYTPITVLVNVAANASSPQVNQVTVSGGGSVSATSNDPTTIISLSCDVNGDGLVNVADIQQIVEEALGILPASHDLNHDGVVNVLDVQIIINAVLTGTCGN